MDQRRRKFWTIHKARDDGDRLRVTRKEGGRGLACIQDSVDASIQRLEDYIKMRGERLITVTKITRKNRKKNKSMNISINKQAKSQLRRLGHS